MKRFTLHSLRPQLLITAAAFCTSVIPASADSWLFDFGSTIPVTGQALIWNSVPNTVSTNSSAQLLDLFNVDGTQTTIDLLMVSRFNGENSNGTQVSTVFPVDATRDSMFGNTELFGGLTNVTPIFKLSSLDPFQKYSFTFYASRTGVSDTRTTDYTVSGSVSGTVTLNVANNIDNFVSLTDITPDAFGEITISLTPAADNNNSNHFTYLGVMAVESEAIPEPASAAMLVGGLGALCFGRRRSK